MIGQESGLVLKYNKYLRWYNEIIARGDDQAEYLETHHILPRSLRGTNTKTNLIKVSARKHFLLHWLLTKFTTDHDFYLMQHAFCCMSTLQGNRVLASWQYALLKRLKSAIKKRQWENLEFRNRVIPKMSLKNREYWEKHPEARETRSIVMSNYCREHPEFIELKSSRMKEYCENNPDMCAYKVEAMAKARDDEEHSVYMLERWGDPDFIEIQRSAHLEHYENNPEARERARERTNSQFENPESRKKIGDASRRAWARRKGEIAEYRTPQQIRKAERSRLYRIRKKQNSNR